MSNYRQQYLSLREKIIQAQDDLSPKLHQIAHYAIDNPSDMALQNMVSLATKIQVQPSALVRFAHHFGFTGFSPMQQIYKNYFLHSNGTGYKERIKALHDKGDQSNYTILHDFATGSAEALRSLTHLDLKSFEQSINMLNNADTIWIMGVRRCYPLASYFHYALSSLGQRNIMIDGTGSMGKVHVQTMKKNDLLLVMSFKDYAIEVQNIAQEAKKRGVPIIAITDSELSPYSKLADILLAVNEVEIHAFRTLSTSMCLALCMIVALGNLMQEDK